jgi:drug/metabolite transporter (DMT)-like permease
MASTSFFAALLEPLIFRRRIFSTEIGFSLLAAVGVVLLFGIAQGYRSGMLVALLSSVLAALFTILNGVLYRDHQSRQESSLDLGSGAKVNTRSSTRDSLAVRMTAYEMLGGLLVLGMYHLSNSFIALIKSDPLPFMQWQFTPQNIGIAAVLGIVCTALPFVGSINVMRTLSPFTICLTVNLEPIYAIALALIHFGDSERMSASFYFAALLILGAVATNGILKSRSNLQNMTN